MHHRTFIAAALVALVAPIAAQAAPVTATGLTAPATDPTVLTYAEPAGTTLAVTGTSNGGANLLDIRCEGSNRPLLATRLRPAASGAWTVTLPARAIAPNVGRTCYLHAVPYKNGGGNRTAFPGRRLAVQGTRTTAISGGPNNGSPFDFRYTAPQLSGRGLFQSTATCGLAAAAALDGTTGSIAQSIFNCAGFIQTNTAGRAGVLIDKQNAFLAGNAANLFAGAGNGLGFLPLQSSFTTDPTSGAVTIRETSRLMRCAPDPVGFPASVQSCSSFTPAGVQLDRTIVQQADGRQALISDTWSAADGNKHEVDAFYQSRFGGTAPAESFPWLGGYTVYPPAFRVTPPPTSGPFTFYVRPSLTTPDGDAKTTQGAVTLQDAPTSMQFATGSILYTQYVRTITPQAPARVVMAFSWGQRQADIATLAGQAQAAMGSSQCVVPNVTRRSVRKARELLAGANCALGKVRHVRSKKVPKARIVLQQRHAGVALPAGTQVSVVVSDGRPKKAKKK